MAKARPMYVDSLSTYGSVVLRTYVHVFIHGYVLCYLVMHVCVQKGPDCPLVPSPSFVALMSLVERGHYMMNLNDMYVHLRYGQGRHGRRSPSFAHNCVSSL